MKKVNKNMRQIKFRAWDKKNKKWLFGYDYSHLGGFSLLGEVVLLGEIQKIQLHDLKDIAIMQYTGLKDKNGKEIYEGDILEFDNKDENNRVRSKVIFDVGMFGVFFEEIWIGLIFLSKRNVELIGNIYQNKDLLK